MSEHDLHRLPLRDADLRQMVMEILEELPDDLQEAVENVVIHIEDRPSGSLLRDHPDLDPRILGLYIGVPLSRQSVFGGFYFPAQIYLYRANIARYARHPRRLREQLRETLLHEIGHHLGLDEEDLRRLEH
jgi:predicted Zn-dependent protease with MMP-like domain